MSGGIAHCPLPHYRALKYAIVSVQTQTGARWSNSGAYLQSKIRTEGLGFSCSISKCVHLSRRALHAKSRTELECGAKQ